MPLTGDFRTDRPATARPRLGVSGAAPAQGPNVGLPAPSNPGFVDARPEAQRRRNPIQAPAATQAPAQAPAQGAAPSLPDPRQWYPSGQSFDFSGTTGHAYVERDGRRMYSYSTPATDATTDQRADAYRTQQGADDRARMMRESHDTFMRAVNGQGRFAQTSSDYDPSIQEQRLAAMQTLGPYAASVGNDQTAVAVEGMRNNPALDAARIGLMNAQAQAARADAVANSPDAKLGTLRTLNADPSLRSLALALGGADPMTINSLPATPAPGPNGAPAINAGNLQQHLAQPQNAGMAGLLTEAGEGNLDLGDVIARAAQYPGFEDMGSPNRQMFDTWLEQRYAGNERGWNEQFYSPEPPPQGLDWLYRRPLGLIPGLFGTGTGPGWYGNYDAAQKRIGLINKHKISPF